MVSIGGYIPLSLIDFPDKLCSIVFFDGCNFHCPFCQNPDLVHPVPTSTVVKPEEVLSHLEKRKKFLDGVVLTGGEPCIQKDLVAFMKKIKELDYAIKLDSNGAFPECLEKTEPYVDYFAMDIKAPLENYSKAAGVHVDPKAIQRSVDFIRNSGRDYEFRTTVVPKLLSQGDVIKIGEWLNGSKKYFLQQFVPRNTLDPTYEKEHAYKPEDLRNMRDLVSKHFEVCEVRGI